jgi:hypothetical protein
MEEHDVVAGNPVAAAATLPGEEEEAAGDADTVAASRPASVEDAY